jgi:hypothetical protein
MHDQPNRGDVPRTEYVESVVLDLLLSSTPPGPWSMHELGKAVGNQIEAVDAVDGLHQIGLVHRSDGLVFVTRAAARFDELQSLT